MLVAHDKVKPTTTSFRHPSEVATSKLFRKIIIMGLRGLLCQFDFAAVLCINIYDYDREDYIPSMCQLGPVLAAFGPIVPISTFIHTYT
ncbi:hypothetical protein F5Y17DRAFT_401481 [Xylariaceae sp. FL0594]|nr:hypothetical protein F5Y17DRAFT_401481 [Xylariaceae sp. FL0594]